MRCITKQVAAAAALVLAGAAGAGAASGPPSGPLTACPPDAVVSGTGCIDKYEASVWRVPNATTSNRGLVARIRQGKATAAALIAAGATQLGTAMDDYAPCAPNGQNCVNDIFAVSLPGVTPSAFMTWFQALAACKNSGKRLPTNAEWQAAVAGTPDPGPDDGATLCNTNSAIKVSSTGSRRACVSARGAFDMVGNLDEWVAEWLPRSTGCGSWNPATSSTDLQCISGADDGGEPGALLRGGHFASGVLAGPLFVAAEVSPAEIAAPGVGFRCAR